MEDDDTADLTPEALPTDVFQGATVLYIEEDLDLISSRYLNPTQTETRSDSIGLNFYNFSNSLQYPKTRKMCRTFLKRCSKYLNSTDELWRGLESLVKTVFDFRGFFSIERPLRLFILAECCIKNAGFRLDTFRYFFSVVLQFPDKPHLDELYGDCAEVLNAEGGRIKIMERCHCIFTRKIEYLPCTYMDLLFALVLRFNVFNEKHWMRVSPTNFLSVVRNTMFFELNEPILRVSTGKEFVEIVDGLSFITFESETDMDEYTRLSEIYSAENPPRRVRISPTKTNDITKIKGWRNKLFTKFVCDPEPIREQYIKVFKLTKKLPELGLPISLLDSYDTPNSQSEEIDLSVDLNEIDKFMKSCGVLEPFVEKRDSKRTGDESSPRKSLLSLMRERKFEEDLPNIVFQRTKKRRSNYLPLVLRCSADDVVHDHEVCLSKEIKAYSLAALLFIGRGHPLKKEIIENLELLKSDERVIDSRWALIAASAVAESKKSRRVRRVLVPIISRDLIRTAEDGLQSESEKNRAQVEQVVQGLVDYVVKKEEFESLTLTNDPDAPCSVATCKTPLRKVEKTRVERELGRLINVTVVDESKPDTNTNCGNEFCDKGCVCQSLEWTVVPDHCKRIACMFDCTCANKEEFARRPSLAKEESTWHQTVIRKSNDTIEISGDKSKSKREKKLPTRYRHNVLLGKEMCLVTTSSGSLIDWGFGGKPTEPKARPVEAKVRPVETKPRQTDSKTRKPESKLKEPSPTKAQSHPTRNASHKTEDKPTDKQTDKPKETVVSLSKPSRKNLRKSTEDLSEKKYEQAQIQPPKKFKQMQETTNEQQDYTMRQELKIGDVYIWCSIHLQYTCTCSAHLYFLKSNVVIFTPNSTTKERLTLNDMSHIMKNTSNVSATHMYNRRNHSARTFGSLIDYTKRNKTETFKSKRALEIDCFVLSSSNSFMKVELPIKSSFNIKEIGKPVEKNIVIDEDRPKVIIANKRKTLPPNFINNIKTKKVNFDLTTNPNTLTAEKKKKYCIGPAHFNSSQIQNRKSVYETYRPVNPRRNYRIGPAQFETPNRPNYKVSSPITGYQERSPINAPVMKSIVKPLQNHKTFMDNCITIEDIEEDKLPEFGLMCLTKGFGYFPLVEYRADRLRMRDPLHNLTYHVFKDVDTASQWLNTFFKSRMLFEDKNVNLNFLVVKQGILAKMEPFHISIIGTKMINRDGILIDKFPPGMLSNSKASTSVSPDNAVITPLKSLLLKRTLEAESSPQSANSSPPQSPKKLKIDSAWSLSDPKNVLPADKATIKPIVVTPNLPKDSRPEKGSAFVRIRTDSSSGSSVGEGRFIPLRLDAANLGNKFILKKRNGVLVKRLKPPEQNETSPNE